jgi:hypothetical protein
MVVTKGISAFVQPRYQNQIFAIIDPELREQLNVNTKVLMYMGFEDTVVNHLLLIKDMTENK